MRDNLEAANATIESLRKELQNSQSQLKSAQSFNVQLKAELGERTSKSEFERLQKEVAKLKKDLLLRYSICCLNKWMRLILLFSIELRCSECIFSEYLYQLY